MVNIIPILFENQDTKYRDFSSKLMPTVDKDTVIGVRIPTLRRIAAKYENELVDSGFMSSLPHFYYEENNVHAFLIERIKDYDKCVESLNAFLPYIDNWATCDSMRPKCFAENTDKLYDIIKNWISSEHPYTVRFAIEMLMVYYLDDNFERSCSDMVASVSSNEYYVNMMIAWYFATALAMQWDEVLPYIEQRRLPVWVHNKTIQKAVESYRIPKFRKDWLKSMKIK